MTSTEPQWEVADGLGRSTGIEFVRYDRAVEACDQLNNVVLPCFVRPIGGTDEFDPDEADWLTTQQREAQRAAAGDRVDLVYVKDGLL